MSKQWAYGAEWTRENLRPVPNPHPFPEPQPKRDHPFDVVVSGDGSKVYVSLLGSELEPGKEVAVYDVVSGKMCSRILLKPGDETGPAASSPMRLHLHPGGRYLWVTNRFSNFISVIDTITDTVVSEIPLDFYAQGLTFSADGKLAYVANRYLDEVFVLDIEAGDGTFSAHMREIGGLDDTAFYAQGGIGQILRQSCGTTGCHDLNRGGFVAGENLRESFISVLGHVIPGQSAYSRLLRAVVRTRDGGYADTMPLYASHAGQTVVFEEPERDPAFQALKEWIDSTQIGPGIEVGNPRSKPSVVELSSDGRHLFVGNSGTSDISIVDTRLNQEVGAIYIQNVTNDLKIIQSSETGEDWMIVTTMGVGFGTAKERDPWGGESWDRTNAASQYTVWRDPRTGAVFSKEKQEILGPYEATDGTANVKFRDIQDDVVAINLSRLRIPEKPPAEGLTYLLKANRYEAHRSWVRYTSDSAEAMVGDMKGDIPPDLMRIVGALPEKMVMIGDRIFVTMQGSAEVQELCFRPQADEPSDLLIPVRNYKTGAQPFGIAAGIPGTASADKLFVANFLGCSISVIDRVTGNSLEVPVDPRLTKLPFAVTNAERGELAVHSSIYTTDNDQACISCHHDELSDGRGWGVSQIMGQEYLAGQDTVGQLVEGTTMLPRSKKASGRYSPFSWKVRSRSMIHVRCRWSTARRMISRISFPTTITAGSKRMARSSRSQMCSRRPLPPSTTRRAWRRDDRSFSGNNRSNTLEKPLSCAMCSDSSVSGRLTNPALCPTPTTPDPLRSAAVRRCLSTRNWVVFRVTRACICKEKHPGQPTTGRAAASAFECTRLWFHAHQHAQPGLHRRHSSRPGTPRCGPLRNTGTEPAHHTLAAAWCMGPTSAFPPQCHGSFPAGSDRSPRGGGPAMVQIRTVIWRISGATGSARSRFQRDFYDSTGR